MADSLADVVAAELTELSRRLTEPTARECLRCYLVRMLSEFGCDGTHRWTMRWRESCAPGARDLLRRLQQRGACCCDCEVIFNVFPDYPDAARPVPCGGVPQPGSAAPCDLRPARRSA